MFLLSDLINTFASQRKKIKYFFEKIKVFLQKLKKLMCQFSGIFKLKIWRLETKVLKI